MRFFRPDGREILEAPPLPRVDDDAFNGLVLELEAQGVTVDPAASLPYWQGESRGSSPVLTFDAPM